MRQEKRYTLTKSEMILMNIVWSMEHPCAIHEIIGKYEEPRPAYTTVATFLKILTNKKFVDFKKGEGKTQLYFPVISRAQYTRQAMEDMKNNLFDGCASSLVKFFVSEEILSPDEIQEILEMISRQ